MVPFTLTDDGNHITLGPRLQSSKPAQIQLDWSLAAAMNDKGKGCAINKLTKRIILTLSRLSIELSGKVAQIQLDSLISKAIADTGLDLEEIVARAQAVVLPDDLDAMIQSQQCRQWIKLISEAQKEIDSDFVNETERHQMWQIEEGK